VAGNGTFRGAINATSLTIGASASVSGLGIQDVSGSRYVDAIYARGTGYNNNAARQIKIGDTFIVNAVTGRGFTLAVIKKSDHSNLTYRRTGSSGGTLGGNQVYDVHGSTTDQINMRDALVELRTNGNGTRAAGEFGSDIIIIIVSYDAWNIDSTNGALLRAEMKLNGATSRIDESSSTNARVPYLLIATAGIGEGNGIEVMTSDAATADYAQYSGTLVDGEVRGTLDGLTQGVIINKGGLTMDLGGAIKTIGKASESDTTAGYFLGYNGSNYTFGVGDANQSMQWTGSELNIVGALNATSLNVTSITGAVTGFDAGKISGDVTEVYPLSSTPNVSFDNSGTPNPTVMTSFSIPAPENSVSKRHRLSLALEIQSRRSSGTGLDTHQIWYWASRKSLGFETVEIGDVTHLSTVVTNYVEVYTISGNVTDQMDNNGAIAPNTNPTAAQIGKIIGVSYQSATDKTNIEVSFGSGSSPHYANGTTMYFSPSQFTASGAYPDSAWQGKQSLILDGQTATYATVPLIASFGSTTVARDYRIYAQNSAQYTNLTVTCPKLYGTVENIA
jgi:hypothetical protein